MIHSVETYEWALSLVVTSLIIYWAIGQDVVVERQAANEFSEFQLHSHVGVEAWGRKSPYITIPTRCPMEDTMRFTLRFL